MTAMWWLLLVQKIQIAYRCWHTCSDASRPTSSSYFWMVFGKRRHIPVIIKVNTSCHFKLENHFLLMLTSCKYFVMYSGLVYTYLAGHVGHQETEGAFRALTQGYKHWASGRLQQLENNPEYCHIRSTVKASMKPAIYHVYILLRRDNGLAKICTATCECAAGYVNTHTHHTTHVLMHT